jgi:hypothetical protein
MGGGRYYTVPQTYETPKGWECPKCNAVMAPTAPCCWYCGPMTTKTVYRVPIDEDKL